jgi:hypothetical protein
MICSAYKTILGKEKSPRQGDHIRELIFTVSGMTAILKTRTVGWRTAKEQEQSVCVCERSFIKPLTMNCRGLLSQILKTIQFIGD